MKQLGDILLEGGLLTTEQLQVAVEEQRRLGRSLGRVLVDLGVLTEGQLVCALAQQIGLRFVDLGDHPVDPEAVALVPEAVCRRLTALPLSHEDGRLLVAMADPANASAVDDLRVLTGREIKAVVATRPDVVAAIDRHHRSDVEPAEPPSDRLSGPQAADEGDRDARFLDQLLTRAQQDRATDVHLEPGERDLRVRFRVDGVLSEALRAPRSALPGLAHRLKVLADLDPAERRLPQDGRLTVGVDGAPVELRLATLPTVWGETLVLRLEQGPPAVLTLADLGLGERDAQVYARSCARRQGLVLVTGPAGSGRSTTLYAALDAVDRPDVGLVTVEERVARRLPGVDQVQTDASAGLTTARALRSALRADPDVVLLDELLDGETARLAVDAALTGTLVLSSLTADDAPSAVRRLVELGVEPFLVASALSCVLAQRLVRRLCLRCRQAHVADADLLRATGVPWSPDEPPPAAYRARGCADCAGTGYSGRLALHEVLAVTEDVERMVVTCEPSAAIARLAREQGTVPLREAGLRQVRAGATSLEEVLRVLG